MSLGVLFLALSSLSNHDALAEPFVIDPSADGAHVYDGHGALSAGASSRLLYDYAEPVRSQILDYLYLPRFGASLHQVKVEIGGDSQSTDGTEASHQHTREDLNCHRGYEWWLLEEARKRNPKVVTHALAWTVPSWVGNDSFFSQDNIDYHISWLKCARDQHPSIGNIDYMGIWNERSWGSPAWLKQLRTALDNEGFTDTKLVIPDGHHFDKRILADIDADADFGKALQGGALGVHYPCDDPQPEVQSDYGLKFWASEDFAAESNWAGAGCWGRLLNTNFVRMNITATIAWSLIWSVYDDWHCFGSGLMYAYWPWSGHYTVNGAIWTSAHHCQFTEPGWLYVGGSGRGILQNGGSYVSLVDPLNHDITILVEKLEADCWNAWLPCPGQATGLETVQFQLSEQLRHHRSLALWSTNETHQFVRLQDVAVDAATGNVAVAIAPDTIVTLSSTSGQVKGEHQHLGNDGPFPFPHQDDFEARTPPQPPRFFADNGGSFEIMKDPVNSSNQVLGQVVRDPPVNNAWKRDVEPITVIGDKSWGESMLIKVDVFFPRSMDDHGYSNIANPHTGRCLDIHGKDKQPGAIVDTWDCVSDYNQQFLMDNGLMRVLDSVSSSNMCVSSGPCPQGVSLCQAICDSLSPNQTWTVGSDGALSVNGLCLEATFDDMATLVSCVAGTEAQMWSFGRPPSGGVCTRVLTTIGDAGKSATQKRGNCFSVSGDGRWRMTEDGTILAHGRLNNVDMMDTWVSIALESWPQSWPQSWMAAYVSGNRINSADSKSGLSRSGRVALVSGWNHALFDNFQVGPAGSGVSAIVSTATV